MAKLIPKVSVSKFQNFATSKEVIIAAVSFVLTPLALSKIQASLANVPFFQTNLTAGFIIVAFLLFLVAFQMTGFVRTVLSAIAAGVFVSAILSFGAVQDALNKVGVN